MGECGLATSGPGKPFRVEDKTVSTSWGRALLRARARRYFASRRGERGRAARLQVACWVLKAKVVRASKPKARGPTRAWVAVVANGVLRNRAAGQLSTSADCGSSSAEFGPLRPSLGRMRTNVGRTRPKLGPKAAAIWSEFGESGPMSAPIGPHSADCPISTALGRHLAKFGRSRPNTWPNSANSAESGPSSADIGHRVGRVSKNLGRCWPEWPASF